MARTKKKTKAKKVVAKKRPTKKAPRGVKKAAAGRPKRKTGAGSRDTEVERHWKRYLQSRTELEAAVEAVQAAEATLTTARDLERDKRKGFDSAKDALERLLEVEPASATHPHRVSEARVSEAPPVLAPSREPRITRD